MRPVVGRLQARLAEEVAQLGGDLDLAGVRPGELVRRGERDVGPEERLDAHRRDRARRADEAIGVDEEERAEGRHELRPVQEGEALLRAQRQRLQPHLAEGDHRRHALPVQLDRPAPDERQGEMGERREVARRADGSLRRDDRVDPEPEEVEEAIHDERPGARVAEGEGVGPQQEHRPDDVAREAARRRRRHG